MSEESKELRPDGDGTPAGEPLPPEGAPRDAREAEAEMARRLDEITRAYAELVNDRESYKRRIERERDRQLQAEKGELAAVLLDTMDELTLAVRGGTGDAARLAEGLRLIADNAGRRLEALGLTRVPSEGHLFDPSIHEAIDLLASPDPEMDGKVIEEIRAGWRLGDRVIRAARVRVGRHVPAAARPEPSPSPWSGE